MQQVIKNNYSTLLRCLEPSNELLEELQSVACVEDRMSSIKQQKTQNDKNDALLVALLEVPDDQQQSVMDDFVAALRSCGQDYVANIFRKDSDKVLMSDKHRKMLIEKTDELCMFLDPENGLLNKLLSSEVITVGDCMKIRNKYRFHEMTRELISTILRKSNDTFQTFIKTLNETGQNHVSYILTGRGDSRPLSEDYRERLKSKRAAVVRSIYPEILMPTLISKGVFTSHDQQRVESRQTNDEKNVVMLDLIARKSQAAFDDFIDTLQRRYHEHVAQELMGPEISTEIEAIVNADVDVRCLEAQLRENMEQSFENDENDVVELLAPEGISVSQVLDGSIIVKFRCKDYAALESLKELYSSRKLDQLFTDAFRPEFADKGLRYLRFSIADEEFQRCRDLKLMTSVHRKALLSSAEKLVDKMTVSSGLLNKLSLCKQRKKAVKDEETDEQQVKMLLDIVSRQPDAAFRQLLEALDDTQQTEAADYIRMCGSVKVTLTENVLTQESGTVHLLICFRHIFCRNIYGLTYIL